MPENPIESNKISMSQVTEKYKDIYKSFRSEYSPALEDEVVFGMAGFNHLIFKNGRRRPNKVIYGRMVLVPLIKPVIQNCTEIVETRVSLEQIDGKDCNVTYHALEARVGNGAPRVRVVVKKIGEKGKYHFQSVMKYN